MYTNIFHGVKNKWKIVSLPERAAVHHTQIQIYDLLTVFLRNLNIIIHLCCEGEVVMRKMKHFVFERQTSNLQQHCITVSKRIDK